MIKVFCSYSDRLSKAFGFICYDLLIAKVNVHGFDKKALNGLLHITILSKYAELLQLNNFLKYFKIVFEIF